MKYQANYHPQKFRNFSFDAQLKALNKLFKLLEQHLAEPAEHARILQHIRELSPLLRGNPPLKIQQLLENLSDDPFRNLRALAGYFEHATLKDSQITLRTGDGYGKASGQDKARAGQITLIADNLRSVYNVGSLFRIAECLAIKELILCGITPDPSHPNMAKTALGTIDKVAWRKMPDCEAAIQELKSQGVSIYALETAEPSESAFKAIYRLPLALVVGNEALGISESTLALADEIIYLPVLGWKNSLNVGVASSVALYQIIFGSR